MRKVIFRNPQKDSYVCFLESDDREHSVPITCKNLGESMLLNLLTPDIFRVNEDWIENELEVPEKDLFQVANYYVSATQTYRGAVRRMDLELHDAYLKVFAPGEGVDMFLQKNYGDTNHVA